MGADSVFAQLYRSDREDWGPETIHLNTSLGWEAIAKVEDHIRIRHTGTREAHIIKIGPAEEMSAQFDANPEAIVKEQLRGRTLIEEPRVTISDKKSRLSPRDKVFRIIETNPAGAVLVTSDTEFEINSED